MAHTCMNTKNHSKVPAVFYSHSPYNADWNATACTEELYIAGGGSNARLGGGGEN